MTLEQKIMNYTTESEKIRNEARKETEIEKYYIKRGDLYFEYLVDIIFDVQWIIRILRNDALTDAQKIAHINHTLAREMEEDV